MFQDLTKTTNIITKRKNKKRSTPNISRLNKDRTLGYNRKIINSTNLKIPKLVPCNFLNSEDSTLNSEPTRDRIL